MAPTECGFVCELIEEIRGLRADLRVDRTKMFGSDEAENPQGRIPRLEAQVSNHEERLGGLEGLRQRANGAGWLVAAVVGLIEVAYHVFAMARR